MGLSRRDADDVLHPDWRTGAACREGSAAHFFAPAHFERKPEKDAREGAARALCRSCPVQRACLEYAVLVQERHGIWGGLNELQRLRLTRKRAAAASSSAAPGSGSDPVPAAASSA